MVISTLIQFESVGGSSKHYNLWGIGWLGLVVTVIKTKQNKTMRPFIVGLVVNDAMNHHSLHYNHYIYSVWWSWWNVFHNCSNYVLCDFSLCFLSI